jgi:hypothetical protein
MPPVAAKHGVARRKTMPGGLTMTVNRIRGLILAVCFSAWIALALNGLSPTSAQAQTDVFTGLASFLVATGPLTEIDFEDLPQSASSDPRDWAVGDFIPNPLTLHGVIFTDPIALQTGLCSSSTCQADPNNPSGGNITLSLNQGASVVLPVGTGGVMLSVEGMGDITFTLQVTDFAGNSISVDGQAVLDDVTYLGFTSVNGIQQVEVVHVGSAGGPLVLSTVLVELSDPDVTIGVWADPDGDGGPSNNDVVFGSATVQGDVVDLRVQFLGPPFSSCETADGTWCHNITWCFEVDQNTATGNACGYAGADLEFTLSGKPGSLFGGPFSFDGALAGLDPCSVGWYDWDTNTLRLVLPLSLLSDDSTLDYAVKGVFRQKDTNQSLQVYNDTAPNSVDFRVAGGFFSSVEKKIVPFGGMPLCSPNKETSLPIQASGTIELFPELAIFRKAPIANMVQSSYFKTTSDNRQFRRGFVELTIPDLPDEAVISHAALILPETRGSTTYPKPLVTHEVSYYYSADLVINTDDYDRATTPISQTFESDENLPTQMFSLDVTDAVSGDHEGDSIGFRIKLAVDPSYTAIENFGTSFDPSTDIPPRVLLRLSEARANVDSALGGTLIYTNTQGTEVTVFAPAGAVSETTRLAYESEAAAALDSSTFVRGMDISTSPGSLVQIKNDFTLGAFQAGRPQSGSILQEPLTLTLHYTDTDVALIDEDTLILNHWNGGEWEYAACGPYDRHPDDNWLAVPICHLSSRFALFGLRDELNQVYLPLVLK